MTESSKEAVPKLTIDQSGEEWPGLLMTYSEPPRGLNFLDIMTFLFGVMLVGIGIVSLYGGVQTLWQKGVGFWLLFSAAIFLLPGIGVIYYTFLQRKRLLAGLKIRYLVSIADGMATFLHDGDTTTLDISKLTRMWIARDTTNGIVARVDIMAYCNGKLEVVFNIMEISRILGDKESCLVTGMVDYLNQHIKAGQREIEAGYEPGYALKQEKESAHV